MRYCEKCKVKVEGAFHQCPLCQQPLPDEGREKGAFPYIPTAYRSDPLFFKVLVLISIAVCVCSLAVNFLMAETGFWSLMVVGGVCCVWLAMAIAVRKRRNIPQNILYQLFNTSLLAVVWDFFTGWNRWSVNYVLPALCVAAILALTILPRMLRIPEEDYVFYLLLVIIVGILPILFLAFGVVTVSYPSVICCAAALIFFSALMVFQGKHLLGDLKKRLHL